MTLSKSRRNIALALVSFALGMLYFIPYIRFSFYDQTLAVYGIDNTQLGTLGSVYGVVAIVCYVVSGFLTARFEAKNLMAISCFATAGASLWLAQLPGYETLLVIYGLMAVFTIATAWSPYTVILRNLGTDEEQGRIFGGSEAYRNLFSAAFGFVAIWLFGLFANEFLGYQGMLYVSAGIYVLFGILCFLLLPKVGVAKPEEQSESKISSLATLKMPGLWLMGLFLFSCYSVITTQAGYLGTYTTQVLGLDANTASALALVRFYLLPILAGIIGGVVVDKSKSRGMFFVIIMVALVASCIISPLVGNMVVLSIAVTTLLSFLAMTVLSTYWSVMGDCGIPLEYTAVASGIISCIAFLPDAYVTIIIGNWLDTNAVDGFNKMFIWMAVWSAVAAVLAFIIHKKAKTNK